MISSLLYLMASWLDIILSIEIYPKYMNAIKRIFKYLKAIKLGRRYPKSITFEILGYFDADLVGCLTECKSTRGTC